MAEIYGLEITTNFSGVPIEKRFPSILTLKDLKRKLELVVGTEASSISIELRSSEGKFVSLLTDDSRNLKDLGVRDGMQLYASDITRKNLEFNDGSMVEKYEISEDAYDQREDSVRAWKKKLMQEKAPESPSIDQNEDAAKGIKVGDRCEVRVKNQMSRRGEIAFVGLTKFREGVWVGVKYDEPVGKNDGSVAGVKYFECDNLYGGFVRPVDVVVGDFPEESVDEL